MIEKREDSNEKLQLYYVKDEYVEYLRKHEKRVWTNSDKGYQRPYVGIVIGIDEGANGDSSFLPFFF